MFQVSNLPRLDSHTIAWNPMDKELETKANEYYTPNVRRLVGGLANLLRETSSICQQLDASVPAEWMVKRVQFFAYDLQSLIPPTMTALEKLDALNRYFFKTKEFQAIGDLTLVQDKLPYLNLSSVLTKRVGAPMVLALLYAFLAHRIELELDFVDLQPTGYLKLVYNGQSHFIDLCRQGRVLTSDEVLETLHLRLECESVTAANLLETISFERFMTDYLCELKQTYRERSELAAVLTIQNLLMHYQPSNLQLLGERALLHRKLGHFKSALGDLKRYFTFCEREKSAAELVRVYDDLIMLLEKNKTHIEIID